MKVNTTCCGKQIASDVVKGKYPLYVGDLCFEIELDSIQPVKNSNEVSLGFKITDKKVIDIIKKQENKIANTSISFVNGEQHGCSCNKRS